jgi:DeoR/GlpR family transcriptional regulator of sugar metabolism
MKRKSAPNAERRRESTAADPVRMPAQIRHQRIMDTLRQYGFVLVTDIAARIGVSTMTIRRDLEHLEKAGKITRTHGGAMVDADAARAGADEQEESIFDRRLLKNAGGKEAIARVAATLVESSQSVGLDVGTTVLTAAQQLAGRQDLRFFTNNLRAALALAGNGSPVYILGGEVRVPELSVVGSSAIQLVHSHFLDWLFLGASAIDENGLYDFSPEDSEVKRAFIDSADRVALLCDASKFERRALARICDLNVVDVLVTNQAPPPRLAAALHSASVEVKIASETPAGIFTS